MKVQTSLIVVASICIGLTQTTVAGPTQPTFDPSNFLAGAPIDNPFFPLVAGTTFNSSATVTDPDTGETGLQKDKDFVTFKTAQIGGVTARVVRATSILDGVLIEDTLDYYAQDKSGNVWYLGEDTRSFEYDDNGKLINTDTSGSFRAGVNGALPGFIMEANPQVGDFYVQEDAAADGAQDQAEVVSLSEQFSTPVGSFTNVLKTRETTPVEPGVVEFKFYAKGIGELGVFEDIQENGQPLNTFKLDSITTSSAAIPLPPAGYVGLITLGLLAGFQKAKKFTFCR